MCGYADGQHIPAPEMLAAVKRIAAAVDVPVSADIEAGYGDPLGTAQRAWEAGAVGINLEDTPGESESTRTPLDAQVDVIRRIRSAVPDMVVNAENGRFPERCG